MVSSQFNATDDLLEQHGVQVERSWLPVYIVERCVTRDGMMKMFQGVQKREDLEYEDNFKQRQPNIYQTGNSKALTLVGTNQE